MDSSAFETFGWRDIVMVAMVTTAVYILVAVLRLWQLRRQQRRPRAAPSEPAMPAPAELPLDPGTIQAEPVQAPPRAAEAAAPPVPRPLPPIGDDPADNFAERLFRTALDSDIQHLRGDLARLRDELAALRAEVGALHQRLERQQGSVNVAPLYSEAMGMALQGLGARAVADRCGISIGEAELVVALTRRDQGYDKTKDEAEDERRDPPDDPQR